MFAGIAELPIQASRGIKKAEMERENDKANSNLYADHYILASVPHT
ncbi:MAG: hypothetical protein U0V70_00900 [Terriglobia bacterium]